jgi:hypothetical protein
MLATGKQRFSDLANFKKGTGNRIIEPCAKS